MKKLVLVAFATAALVLPAVAAAKGPSQAQISGPGLSSVLTITGNGEGDTATDLGVLVTETGFFAEVFGQYPSQLIRTKPANLGPRYTVVYTVPGPETSTLMQELYPYAAGGPLSYLPPHQRFWGTQETLGGWYRGSGALEQMLVKAGLPQTAPATTRSRAGSTRTIAIAAGFGIVVAGAALAALRRRGR
jgi:hypothetical protein